MGILNSNPHKVGSTSRMKLYEDKWEDAMNLKPSLKLEAWWLGGGHGS